MKDKKMKDLKTSNEKEVKKECTFKPKINNSRFVTVCYIKLEQSISIP
jgi:hypothetical protein